MNDDKGFYVEVRAYPDYIGIGATLSFDKQIKDLCLFVKIFILQVWIGYRFSGKIEEKTNENI